MYLSICIQTSIILHYLYNVKNTYQCKILLNINFYNFLFNFTSASMYSFSSDVFHNFWINCTASSMYSFSPDAFHNFLINCTASSMYSFSPAVPAYFGPQWSLSPLSPSCWGFSSPTCPACSPTPASSVTTPPSH